MKKKLKDKAVQKRRILKQRQTGLEIVLNYLIFVGGGGVNITVLTYRRSSAAMRKIVFARRFRRPRVLFIPVLYKSIDLDISPFPPNVKHPRARASAFAFFSVKISHKTACFEEKIYRKVEEVEKVEEFNHNEPPVRPHGQNGLLASNVYFVRVGLCRPWLF
ncbi:MAG: hypothetical protein LBL44_02930 [Treponema sp.]|jgi:hypothetical protein|nr:hypothetical protein [Treponema sp.]